MDAERRTRAFTAVEKATELPMLALSLAIIPLLVAEFFVNLSRGLEVVFLTADWAIWSVFAFELVVKTYLSTDRAKYVKSHWFDVLIVVLPFVRPLRVLRSDRALRVLRAGRIFSFGSRSVESARAMLDEHGLKYFLLVALVLFIADAALVTVFEHGAGGPISNFGDGLWWAASTVTTVGYGDKYPVTAEGKGAAVLLMLLGVSLYGVVAANIAAYLLQSEKTPQSGPTLADVLDEVRRLRDDLAKLQVRAVETIG